LALLQKSRRLIQKSGYAAAHSGKALPFRKGLVSQVPRLRLDKLRRSLIKNQWKTQGKPEAYRNVLRQSRITIRPAKDSCSKALFVSELLDPVFPTSGISTPSRFLKPLY